MFLFISHNEKPSRGHQRINIGENSPNASQNQEAEKPKASQEPKIPEAENPEETTNKIKEPEMPDGQKVSPLKQKTEETTDTIKNPPNMDTHRLSPDDIYIAKCKEADAAGTATKYLELAQWCEQLGMVDRARDQYYNVLKLEPDNVEVRKKFGHIYVGTSWMSKVEARRQGYYEYQEGWYLASELEERGLVLYEGKWITKAEKTKLDSRLMPDKDKLAAVAKEKNEKKDTDKTELEPKPSKRQADIVTFPYHYTHVTTPPGYWQDCPPPLFFAPLGEKLFIKSMQDTQDDYYMVLTTYMFGSIELDKGIYVRGSHYQDIMRGYALYMRNSFDALKVTAKPADNFRIGSVTFFQAEGLAKRDKQVWIMVFAFFKCGTFIDRSHCITFMTHKKKFSERVSQKAEHLLRNLDSIKTISKDR
jgi:hypothetical protein